MKQFISILLAVIMVFSIAACGSQDPADVPTDEATNPPPVTDPVVTEPPKDLTSFQLGEITFDLKDGLTADCTEENAYMVTIADDAAWTYLYASDVSYMESADLIESVAAMQQATFADPDVEHFSESTSPFTFSGMDVTFAFYGTLADDGDPVFHAVGTFTDTWYVYTYVYTAYDSSSDYTDAFVEMIRSAEHSGKESRFPVEEPTEAATEPTEPEVTTYGAGMYKVGTDIPAGEYVFIVSGDRSAYVCVSSDSNQDDILENENFDFTFFATVSDGQYVKAQRCSFMAASDYTISISDDGSFSDGMYRVGIDIPAGEYKLTCTGDRSGYYCIYNDSIVPFDIENNDNFDGSTYVTVKDGQYLIMNRCTATPA